MASPAGDSKGDGLNTDTDFFSEFDKFEIRPEIMKELFDSLDEEKRGYLSYEEVYPVLFNKSPNLNDEEVAEICKTMDRNGDGQINFDEFHIYFNKYTEFESGLETAGKLVCAQVFARVRPFSTGGGHDDTGEKVDKKLDKFDADSLTVSGHKYTFPDRVFMQESTQDEVYKGAMAPLVDEFLLGGRNVFFFMYGQTGTGKTHTLFGTDESLKSSEPHEGWGLFPRAVNAILKGVEGATAAGEKFCVSLSAIEFYFFGAYDLLGDRAPVMIGSDSMPVGHTQREIKSVADMAQVINDAYAARTVASTKMNAGSSRSHTALILNFTGYGDDVYTDPDKPVRDCLHRSYFCVVDLAGAERPGKTGAERTDMLKCGMHAMKGGVPTVAMQGCVINFELSGMCTSIIQATERYTSGNKYVLPMNSGFTSEFQKFFGNLLLGSAAAGMMLCISPAERNGWETWFSCEMGEKIRKFKAPVRKLKVTNGPELYKQLLKDLAKAEKTLQGTPKKGAPSSKYYPQRYAAVEALKALKCALEKVGLPGPATPS